MYKLEDKKILFYGDINFKCLEEDGFCLGYGSTSQVYKFKLPDGKFYALKVFNEFMRQSLESFEEKLKINIDSYISPKRILYVNDKFSGYLMDYCRNYDLSRRNLYIPVEDYARNANKLIDDTNKLSELKYTIYDTFISNVMYDKGFKMIDMDDYSRNTDKSIEEVKKLNIERLNKMLVNIFINSTGLASMFFQNVEMTKLMSLCNSGKISFEELFNQVCSRAYSVADEEITNIRDVGKVLKKAKKF